LSALAIAGVLEADQIEPQASACSPGGPPQWRYDPDLAN
jgi:hypothetical protein